MAATQSSKKLSALETHYRERFERLEKDNRLLRQKLEKVEQENGGLKKSLYELSLRYNMVQPGETARPFDLDSIGINMPPDLLLSLQQHSNAEAELKDGARKQQDDYRKFYFKYQFPRHTGAVYCVRFSQRGRLLASASYDKTMRIWDMEKQREVFTGEQHTQPVSDVQWGRGDLTVISGSYDHHIAVWDLESTKMMYDCEVDGMIATVAAHPVDENLIYVGTTTRRLYMLDRRQPKPVSMAQHDSIIYSSYIYRDGSHVITGDSAGAVSMWDSATLRVVDRFYNDDARVPISCIRASPSSGEDEGRYFSVNSYDNGTLL
eukprot:TRINITY_DN1092_c0_g1_i1.p1 TRINITY_DN1092_c0_g1~~TRINITY_DN1092_c0_g1_i1.p1  ORF type:complete len:347 (-),score=62.03 TRINITY_DN1092_c0_g1_i1:67-1026(-)